MQRILFRIHSTILIILAVLIHIFLSPIAYAARSATPEEIAASDKLLLQDADKTHIAGSIAKHLPWGVPAEPATATHEHLLVQVDYVINYDDDLRVPIWSAYRLRKEDVSVNRERIEGFRRDARLSDPTASLLSDYSNSGYDRGHMAPSDSFPQTVSSMVSTYILSNMTPQLGELNQQAWKWLEEQERAWAQKYSRVWVITGAIFDKNGDGKRDADADAERIKSRVGIPTGYYKIIVRKPALGQLDAIAFVVPQVDPTRHDTPKPDYFKMHLGTIDQIEQFTGLDFFPKLIKSQQDALESKKPADLWSK